MPRVTHVYKVVECSLVWFNISSTILARRGVAGGIESAGTSEIFEKCGKVGVGTDVDRRVGHLNLLRLVGTCMRFSVR
jgi:hypothetical protein